MNSRLSVVLTVGRTLLLMAASSATLAGQGSAASRSRVIADFDLPWIPVFRDSAFRIALDTSRIKRVGSNTYLLWMQTRWFLPRRGGTKRTASPFNRELIHTFLRCEPLAYKVARTVVSLDDGPPVDSVGAGVAAAKRADWHPVSSGSADAGAGAQACEVLSHRSGQPHP